MPSARIHVVSKLYTDAGVEVVAFYLDGVETKPDRLKDTKYKKRVCT